MKGLRFNRTVAGLLPRQKGGVLLGLAFEGATLQGVEVRRTNGSVVLGRRFTIPLTLDVLTAEPDLVGREVRKRLDAEGIRERSCVVCIPESWILTLTTTLPDLAESDRASFMQIEAERGFAAGGDAFVMAHSIFQAPGGENRALLAGVAAHHVSRLEAVLSAARLRPASFTVGTTALAPADAGEAEPLVAVRASGGAVHIEVTSGGGVAVLRTIERAFDGEGGVAQLDVELLLRELRITLGQLPADVLDRVRVLRVFGNDEAAAELVEVLGPRLGPQGIVVEAVRHYPAGALPLVAAPATPVSAALSVAVRHLAGKRPVFEFLPPRVSSWRQFTDRYASQKLVLAGGIAGALAGVIALAFGVQQAQLAYWSSRWNGMKTEVNKLDAAQRKIRQFRPWFDDSCRSLSVLRRLTEAFPEDGALSAKSVEIRDRSGITCSGIARDNQALLRVLDKLAAAPEVTDVKVEQVRGRAPMQFTLSFQWAEQGGP